MPITRVAARATVSTTGTEHADERTQGRSQEARLRAAAAAGDRAAFAELYQTYRDDVLKYLIRRCRGDRHLAEDLTQDTFARALAAMAGYRETGRPFRAWLVTIAGNLLTDYWRSGWHRHHVRCPDLAWGQDEEDAPVWGGSDVDPAVTVLARDRQRQVTRTLARAVAALTDRQREVLELRYLGDRSVTETADALGLDEGAVKAAAYRARLALAGDPALAALR